MESFRTLSRVELEDVIVELERQVDEARYQRKYSILGDLRLALVRAKECRSTDV